MVKSRTVFCILIFYIVSLCISYCRIVWLAGVYRAAENMIKKYPGVNILIKV